MENNYENLKQLIGQNISEYRKLSNMSQLEFAEKLNYSDKAVSKWERGESLPDIVVIKQIADIFGITVNDLVGQKDVKKKRIDLRKLVRTKTFTLLLSIGLVWLVFAVAFVGLEMFDIWQEKNWLMFVFAIPASAIIAIVFFAIWEKTLALIISESVLVWSVALSFCLSISYQKIWLIFVVAAPLQILIVLWNWFRNKKKEHINFNKKLL